MGSSHDKRILAHCELHLIAEVELVEPDLGDPNSPGVADPDDSGADCLLHGIFSWRNYSVLP
jgi:hypothetical protein